MEKKIKLETYKKVDLFFNEHNSHIYFEFEGRDLEVKYLFEAHEIIDAPVWEDCDLKGYFIDGTFSDYVGKAIATRRNRKNGKPDWMYKGRFDTEYKRPNYNEPKVFPYNKRNADIFQEFEAQREVVLGEERKLKKIISKLS